MQIIQSIQNRIYEIHGERVMLDFDLAALYHVETKALNQAVKRNSKRFPPDFMFRLSISEWESIQLQSNAAGNPVFSLRSQIVTSNDNTLLKLQSSGSNRRGGTRYLPYAFTEQGVAMLSGVLSSDTAIHMNIAIMRAFVEVRKVLLKQTDTILQLQEIRERLSEHDGQLSQLYDAMENLLDEKGAQRKWEERERIGFKK